MSICKIENLAKNLAQQIINEIKGSNYTQRQYLIQCNTSGDITGYTPDVFSHRGLYAFRISKGAQAAVAYIGKSEGESRLRHHLTGKNKNGTPLAISVRHKYIKLKKAISQGFCVNLCLYENNDFGKPSLSCIEIAAALHARDDCAATFPDFEHWNERIG
jgi:hypothetical protein